MSRFAVLVILMILMTAANVFLLTKVDDALKRIEKYEASSVSLIAQFDQLAECASQCDAVILQRQNAIIVELKRLDYNQRQLIDMAAPLVEELEEIK